MLSAQSFIGICSCWGETIPPFSSVRNLGVILDPSADMEDHIKKICKTCHCFLVSLLQFSDENYRFFQIGTFLATEGLYWTVNHCN